MRKAFVAAAVCVVAGLICFASPALASGSPARPASHSAQVAPAIQSAGFGACGDPANLCYGNPKSGYWCTGCTSSSPNYRAQFTFQFDGNLVVYDEWNNPRWASNTMNIGRDAYFQYDGNFVVYDAAGNPVWASNTWNHPQDYLVIQGDGNVVIYDPGDVVLWATGTNH